VKSLSEGNFVSPLSASCLAALVRHGGMNISGVCTPVIGQAVGCKRERERERERDRHSTIASFSASLLLKAGEEPGSEVHHAETFECVEIHKPVFEMTGSEVFVPLFWAWYTVTSLQCTLTMCM